MIFALQVATEGIAIRLVEEGVDQRVHTRGHVSHPYKKSHELLKMFTVVLTDSNQHIGDEERTPHHQEKEKNNAQNFGGPLLIFNSLHHSSSTLISWTANLTLHKQKCRHLGGGTVVKQACLS